jgi:hypothetical protein
MRIPARYLRRLAAMGTAAALTVVLAQNTTSAAFTAQTGDTSNQVTAAADFCSSPGRADALSAGTVDTAIYQSQPTTNFASNVSIGVLSPASAVARALIKFPLAAKPSGCVIASAVLTMRVNSGTAGSTIQVYRAAAAWNPTTVIWNTDPGFTGTAATNTSAVNSTVVTWNVAPQVTALYAGPDYGFEIKDSAEGVGNNTQLYDSMEAVTVANRPKLVITWN